MISKKNIWVLTLFSLILVLSVYYITMPQEFLESTNIKSSNVKTSVKEENDVIAALKLENEEEKNKKIKEIQTILTDEEKTNEEKNKAYEDLKTLNIIKGKEEELEVKIKEKYKIDNFVKIDDDKVSVVVIKDENDSTLASNIMKLVQDNFTEKVFITVKFQK